MANVTKSGCFTIQGEPSLILKNPHNKIGGGKRINFLTSRIPILDRNSKVEITGMIFTLTIRFHGIKSKIQHRQKNWKCTSVYFS